MTDQQEISSIMIDKEDDCTTLLQKYQRDINRMSENDRNTRKRGLQKLLEDLPWRNNKQKKGLEKLICNCILAPILVGISDPVEKCRELSLSLLASSFTVLQSNSLNDEMIMNIVRSLCQRINDLPFAETSEELRLQLLELIKTVIKHPLFVTNFNNNSIEISDLILSTMSKSLLDTFPSAKRACAEIVCSISLISPISVRMCFKSLLKALIGNATHQHSKTRSATLQAIGMGLGCLTDEYETLMKEPVIQLLSRMIADRSISTRKELAFMCTNLLLKRISIFGRKAITDSLSLTYENHQKTVNKYGENNSTEIMSGGGINTLTGELNDNSVSADIQLISLLLLLQGDDSEEVIAAAKQVIYISYMFVYIHTYTYICMYIHKFTYLHIYLCI
jgi:dynein assembly factor 5